MDKSINAKIRLEQAQRKINKRIYPSCKESRLVVKLNERRGQLNKDIEDTFSIMHANGFRPNVDNQNPRFFKEFDFILYCEKEILKISKRVDNLCLKIGKSENEIMKEMYYLNAGRGSISY